MREGVTEAVGEGVGVGGGLWQEVERGHQVGNLWQSF